MNNRELASARKENFLKAVKRKGPKYIPKLSSGSGAALAYAGVTYWDIENDEEKTVKAMSKMYDELRADLASGSIIFIAARANEILHGCTENKFAKDGITVEHIQKPMMNEDEYGIITKDFDNFVNNTLLKRKYPFLFSGNIKEAAKTVEAAFDNQMFCYAFGPQSKTGDYVIEHYGIPTFYDKQKMCTTPGDLIFDRLRGFTGTITDLRRHFDEMVALCDVLWEKKCDSFEGAVLSYENFPMYFAHIPTYLRPKQYDKLCWQYFKTQVENIDKAGSTLYICLEGKWSHLLDYLLDLPQDSLLMGVDDDDIFELSSRVGHHQAMIGGVKLSQLRLADRQTNIDYAKKVIDECAGNYGFVFGCDKAWICPGDINQNLFDVYAFADEYGKY